MRTLHIAALLLAISFICTSEHPFKDVENSFPSDPDFFPIGVWTQETAIAKQYKAMGVNYYYGLWKGPTAKQINELKAADMSVICKMNEYAKKNLLDEKIIIGWMHRDEPDLAHVYPAKLLRAPGGKQIIKDNWPEIYEELDLDNNEYKGWGMGAHPINNIQKDYKTYKEIDPSRPVFLQLSKGVALAGKFNGRGDRSGKTWEYPLYIKGSDVVSFDIYPVAYGMSDELWRVAHGVDALRQWGSDKRPLIVAIEAGFGDKSFANKEQQRSQIWMSINHGANGIFWFCHRWQKIDGKNTLVSDKMPIVNKEVRKAVTEINQELLSLAAVINSKPMNDLASATGLKLDLGARNHDGHSYVFAVERANKAGTASIRVKGISSGTVEVINEGRTLTITDGSFSDEFSAQQCHLYKITSN